MRQILSFLVAGYLLFNRTFSYIGVPASRIFLGEVVLGSFLLARGGSLLKIFSEFFSRRSTHFIAMSLLIFLAYGGLQFIRGVINDYPFMEVVRDSAFYYYALYLVVGMYIVRRISSPYELLRKLAYWLAVLNAVYGLAYLAVLGHLSDITLPGTPNVWLFAQTSASAVAILMLIALFPLRRDIILLLILNVVVLLGIQVRAEWLGFVAGIVVLSLMRRTSWLFVRVAILISLVLALAYGFDLSLPSPVGRGGELSVRGIIGRALAPLDIEAAWQLTEHAPLHEVTFVWRVVWWASVWETALSSIDIFLFGNGFGFDLTGLVGYGEATGLGGLRTPHSFIVFAVGYTGVIGLSLFILVQVALLRFFLRFCRDRLPEISTLAQFGASFVVFQSVMGAFGSIFEAPYGAIPYYLLVGFVSGAISRWTLRSKDLTVQQGDRSRYV